MGGTNSHMGLQLEKVELSRPELSALPSRPVSARHRRTSPTSMANIFVTSSVRQPVLYEKYFVTSSVRQPDLYEKSGSPSFSEVEQPTSERDDGISASRPLYMESCTDFLLYGTSTATSTTPCIATAVTTTASIAPLREGTAHRRISYPTLTPSSSSAVSLVTVFSS